MPKGKAVVPSQRQKKLASSPVKEFLHHDFGAGAAEGAAEAVVDRRERLGLGHRYGHALAGGKPVRLDDDRRALVADIGFRRLGGR